MLKLEDYQLATFINLLTVTNEDSPYNAVKIQQHNQALLANKLTQVFDTIKSQYRAEISLPLIDDAIDFNVTEEIVDSVQAIKRTFTANGATLRIRFADTSRKVRQYNIYCIDDANLLRAVQDAGYIDVSNEGHSTIHFEKTIDQHVVDLSANLNITKILINVQ